MSESSAVDLLDALIERGWSAYRRAIAGRLCVLPASLPVLWFGDSRRYFDSTLRVVTVATNPSDQEFPEANPFQRFPRARWSTSPPSRAQLVGALDAYFETDPLPWFDALVPLLDGFDASYDGKSRDNTALHIDICTPLATIPTWSKLLPGVQGELRADGVGLWHDLVRYLRPNIVLASFAQQPFREVTFPWITEHQWISGLEGPRKATWFARIRIARDHEALWVMGNTVKVPFGCLTHEERRGVGPVVLGTCSSPLRSADEPNATAARRVTAAANAPSVSAGQVDSAGRAIEPRECGCLGEAAAHLREWRDRNHDAPDSLRLNGATTGSAAAACVAFTVGGFLAADCSDDGLDGTRFNGVFCLAGDTQKVAVCRFLLLYDQHRGDTRRIFDPGPSRGASLKLYLRVPEGRDFKGWNCLDGTTSDRLEGLRRRL